MRTGSFEPSLTRFPDSSESCETTGEPDVGSDRHGVSPYQTARHLRGLLGLPTAQPLPGERAASFHRPLPATVHGLDVGAWIAWCLVGLGLFADGLPSMRRVQAEAKRVVMGVAMLRSAGSISGAARALHMTRKVLRDNLRAQGLYPWPEPTLSSPLTSLPRNVTPPPGR